MALTKEDLAEVAKIMSAGMAEAMKPVVERLGQSPQQQQQFTAHADPTKVAPAKPLTMEDVTRAMKETLDARDQQQASAEQRSSFQRDKLKDLPSIYQKQLGTDPAKFGEDEQRIRNAYRDDLKARGFTPPNVGGDPAADGSAQGGTSPANGVDVSKLTAPEQIAIGLRSSQPGKSQSFGSRVGTAVGRLAGSVVGGGGTGGATQATPPAAAAT